MIKIKAKPKRGFRRCGMYHPSSSWQEYPNDRFTAKELKILQAEKNLEVKVVGKNDAKKPVDAKKGDIKSAAPSKPTAPKKPASAPKKPASAKKKK